MNKNKALYILTFILLLVLIYFPVFYNLGFFPIRIWDESRIAVSAQEMIANGNHLVPHVEGKPDMWNVKPPLLVWLQVFSMKLSGYNESAVRFPSALAAVILPLYFFFFAHRVFRKYRIGFFAGVVLVSAAGYIRVHAVRTGDYDSLLTLFSTLAIIHFFLFTEAQIQKKKNLHLVLFFVFMISGVFTKGITILLFIPALFIYLIYKKKWKEIIADKVFLFLSLFALLIVGTYYGLREIYSPGYLDAVYNNELGGRYFNTLENHNEKFWFYLNEIRQHLFKKWFWFLIAAWMVCIFINDVKLKRFVILITFAIITFFIIISFGKTKLEWYAVPLYPLFALIIGIGLDSGFRFASSYLQFKNKVIIIFLYAATVFIFYLDPYKSILKYVFYPEENKWEIGKYHISYYLRSLENKNSNNYVVCHEGYRPPLLFYMNVMRWKGSNIKFEDCKNLRGGQTAIANQDSVKKYITSHFLTETIDQYGNVSVYRIVQPNKNKEDNKF